MDLDATCAIATLFSIVVAALKILTVVLAFVTTLVRLVKMLRSRRRRRHSRGRVHPPDHAVGEDEWLSSMLGERGSSVRPRELEEGTESQSGRARR